MSAEQRFGPNTPAIERVLAQIESATPEQVAALGDAWRSQHEAESAGSLGVETLMGPYSSVFTDPREVVAA